MGLYTGAALTAALLRAIRHALAQQLGASSYAALALASTMAETPGWSPVLRLVHASANMADASWRCGRDVARAEALLWEVGDRLRPRVAAVVAAMERARTNAEDTEGGPISAPDVPYYLPRLARDHGTQGITLAAALDGFNRLMQRLFAVRFEPCVREKPQGKGKEEEEEEKR
jgi:hypothetical protein